MTLRKRLYHIIFEAESPAGRAFDIVLLWIIGISILTVVLDSVPAIHLRYGEILIGTEWVLTAIFTIEFLLRLYCVDKPLVYIFSFYGLIDILAIIPSYLVLLLDVSGSLLVLRALRLMRIFRIFKLGRYVREEHMLRTALGASWPKIMVFLEAIVLIVIVVGTLMYMIEGADNGFTSIPVGIYWAIVTMTTVGYGDVVPQTPLGQSLAGVLMITGYGVLAVPTGIVSAELANVNQQTLNSLICPSCLKEGHDRRARFCSRCGVSLD